MDLFGAPAPSESDPAISISPAESVGAPPDSLNEPRAATFCLGHEDIETRILEMIGAQRMPHALVFSGPPGIGKATMAFRLAKFLMSRGDRDEGEPVTSLNTDPDHPAVRQIIAGGHPDVLSIERTYDATNNTYKDSVPVAEIRKIPQFLRMTAAAGGWRVVIVDDADTMNRSAQNGILKILEEPPRKTLIILVAHRPGALIPTIRSRVQVLRFTALSREAVQALLTKAQPEITPADMEMIVPMAGGSIGKAIAYLEDDGPEILTTIQDVLSGASGPAWDSVYHWSDGLGRATQSRRFDLFCEIMLWCFGALVHQKARGSALDANPALSFMNARYGNSSLEDLLKICDNLQAHFETVQTRNLDKRQAVISAFGLVTA